MKKTFKNILAVAGVLRLTFALNIDLPVFDKEDLIGNVACKF